MHLPDTLISQPIHSLFTKPSSCEFLRKLDLTLNFIDFDELAASMEHLARLPHLQDLFMMGNPAAQVCMWHRERKWGCVSDRIDLRHHLPD